jgi:hypothetical protein
MLSIYIDLGHDQRVVEFLSPMKDNDLDVRRLSLSTLCHAPSLLVRV